MEIEQKANILIVDDHQENLLAIKAILDGLEINIFKAISGKEALKLLLKDNFAVILLDIQMPEMDGFEVAKLIRNNNKTKNIPIIFITAFGHNDNQIMEGYSLGAVDYLFKPVVPKILLTKVSFFVELFKQNQELKQTKLKLERSNKELEQFAYVASHDLQEPLRMVASYVQLLEKRYKDKLDEDALEFINYAVDGATRMQILINDLLNFSRVDTKGKPFKKTDLTDCLARAIINLRMTINENSALITNNDLPELNVDSDQIVQVFQNLIGNAIKFSPDRTPIIHISAYKIPDFQIISIKDNGIGIDPQFVDRIFVIFQRLHTMDKYSGTGIGLSICKKIIERHGGKIWVESEPDSGSTFFFTIPDKN